MEWLVFIILTLLAFGLFWRLPGVSAVLRGVFFGVLAVTMIGAWQWNQSRVANFKAQQAFHEKLPSEGGPHGYVSSDTCHSCHPDQYESWHASYHRTMTQYVEKETVMPKFDKVSLSYYGRPVEIEWVDGQLWATMDDPKWLYDTPIQTLKISSHPPFTTRKRLGMMTGSHHMQVYWMPSGQGNSQDIFPFCYLKEEQRWVPFKDTFLRDPAMSHYDQKWNGNCIECHVTLGQPRPISPVATKTQAAELGISCEACHGPGERHVKLNKNPARRYQFHQSGEPDPTIVDPQDLDHERSSMVCGQCHGIHWISDSRDYYLNGIKFRPGGLLNQNKKPVRAAHLNEQPWLDAPLKANPRFLRDRYWSDGMVRVGGRDYTAMIESPCYLNGELSCISCHQMHHPQSGSKEMELWRDDQIKPGMDSNESCLQCHESMRENVSEHTHHLTDSTGSSCYNCHMPHTTYGLLKAIRSHQIDAPSIQTNLETGRPNACNLCHLDQTLEWSSHYLNQWYGQPKLELSPEDQKIAASVLWLLKGDAGLRALIAWHYGWDASQTASGAHWQVPLLARLLEDPYSAVRFITARSLKSYKGLEGLEFDFLGDPLTWKGSMEQALRIWNSSNHPQGQLSDPQRVLFKSSVEFDEELIRALLSKRVNRSMDLQE
ncbi:multiheme c-type cytochrome [bacterium]|nr:multiheme c-type cytochrome [bacterium]